MNVRPDESVHYCSRIRTLEISEAECPSLRSGLPRRCYHCCMFNFGKPKTAGDWIIHIAGGIVALFLVWWMLRMFVL